MSRWQARTPAAEPQHVSTRERVLLRLFNVESMLPEKILRVTVVVLSPRERSLAADGDGEMTPG